MFSLIADKVALYVSDDELLTSGSVKIYECRFSFSPEWEGVDKTAVFMAGGKRISTLIDENGMCTIPHEVLEKYGLELYAGVYGTKNGELVMPTVMAKLGMIQPGAVLGENTQPKETNIYDEILAKANKAEETANRALEAAGSGGGSGGAGLSAYDAALLGGYNGTEQEFYTDLAAVDGLAEWFEEY